MAAAIDAKDRDRIGEPVERQGAGETDDMSAIDEAFAGIGLGLSQGVEMHPRGVLIEPRRHHVLGLLHRHAIAMIDLLAGLVVLPEMRAAGRRGVVEREIGMRRQEQILGRNSVRRFRHMLLRRRRFGVALGDHHPAHIVEHHFVAFIAPFGAQIDDAALAAGILLEPDHFGSRAERLARMHRMQETALRVTEIGDGVQRNIRHAFAEHSVKHQKIVQRRLPVAQLEREGAARLQHEARAGEGQIERGVAVRQGARRGMRDALAEVEILEEIARGALVLAHPCSSAAMASASATVSRAISACSRSTMRPSSAMAPLSRFSGNSKAAMILRAASTSSFAGANTSLHGASCDGWISVLPSKPKARAWRQLARNPWASAMSLKT